MQDLPSSIDQLYSTHSDVERRATMTKLTNFFATPASWNALLELFTIAISSQAPVNVAEQKRRHRICFFAGNALLTKIRKEKLGNLEMSNLIKSIFGILIHQDVQTNTIQVRDPKSEILGRPTVRRLVLCLATLAIQDSSNLEGYVNQSISLLGMDNLEANYLGLEMLQAIANPFSDDEDVDEATKTSHDTPPILRDLALKIMYAIEIYLSSRATLLSDRTLLLECVRAWLRILNSPDSFRINYSLTFAFALKSLSTETRIEPLRSSCGIYEYCAGACRLSNDVATKDALLDGILLARNSFRSLQNRGDDDACNAIGLAFSYVAEADSARITRGSCGNDRHIAMIDFALEILTHRNRSSVARNVLDFFLCVQDVPTQERVPQLNEQFFLRLLGQLVLSCEVSTSDVPTSPEDEEGSSDVLLYRSSSDGPRDLFASMYAILSERYVYELVAIIANPEFHSPRAEAALFALRCASKEICQSVTKQDPNRHHRQHFALYDLFDRYLRISFRNERFFRASLCATIADFSPILHILGDVASSLAGQQYSYHPSHSSNSAPGLSATNTVVINLEYVMKNLEDPSRDVLLESRCCYAFVRLCSRHAKVLSPLLEPVLHRLTSNAGPLSATVSSSLSSRHSSSSGAENGVGVNSSNGSNHAKYSHDILENRRSLAEGISRLCSIHVDTPRACKLALDAFLFHVKQSGGSDLEVQTSASLVKFFPPDNKMVVSVTFEEVWKLLGEVIMQGSSTSKWSVSDAQIEAWCDLIISFFFCCASIIPEDILSQVLTFVCRNFQKHPMPCLAQIVCRSIELFSGTIFTPGKCNEVLGSLLVPFQSVSSSSAHHINMNNQNMNSSNASVLDSSDFPDAIPVLLEAIRRAFLFMPESLFAVSLGSTCKLCNFVMTCVLAEEREIAREACVVLVDFVTRTRQGGTGRENIRTPTSSPLRPCNSSSFMEGNGEIGSTSVMPTPSSNDQQPTRWNVFQNLLDDVLWTEGAVGRLAEHVALLLARNDRPLVADNLCDLLYCLVRNYPIKLAAGNGALEHAANSSSKESFRRFVLSRVAAH